MWAFVLGSSSSGTGPNRFCLVFRSIRSITHAVFISGNIFSLVLWFALRSCERWKAGGLFRRASFGGLRPRSKVSRFRLFGKLRWIGCCFLSQSSCNRAGSLSLIWITMCILSQIIIVGVGVSHQWCWDEVSVRCCRRVVEHVWAFHIAILNVRPIHLDPLNQIISNLITILVSHPSKSE